MARIYEHAIFGGNELRHEGCAPRCCEVAAEIVRGIPSESCGGCGGELREAPRAMDFDRQQPCEQHAAAPDAHLDAETEDRLSGGGGE